MTTLLTTATPSKDYPGVVPTYPVAFHLARRLIDAGEPVRILTNAPGQEWPKGAEIVEGHPAKPSEVSSTLFNIERLFLADADPLTVRELLLQACAGGVRRVVVLSSHGPEVEIEYEPESWHWLAIEVVAERTVPEWVHIRPSPLMGSVLIPGEHCSEHALADLIGREQPVGIAHDDGPYPHIHEDDLAKICCRALLEPEFAGKVLDLYGPLISIREMVATIASRIGREIATHDLVPEDDGDVRPLGFERSPEAEAALTSLLGRPPRSFAQWVDEHREAFAGR